MKLLSLIKENIYDELIESRDYWDINLEYNLLRTKNTSSTGAFIAFKLENAGDILRELGKKIYRDKYYIEEKIQRIRMTLNWRDWNDNDLTDNEYKYIQDAIKKIHKIPNQHNEIINCLVDLFLNICNLNSYNVKVLLNKIENLISKYDLFSK